MSRVAHAVLSEAVPRATGCDPASLEVLPCVVANEIDLKFSNLPGDLETITGAELLVVSVDGLSKDLLEADDCHTSCSGVEVKNPEDVVTIQLSDELKKLDNSRIGDRVISEMVKRDEFKGKIGSSTSSRLPAASVDIRYLTLLGVGSAGELTAATTVKLGQELAAVAKRFNVRSMGVALPKGFTERQVQSLLETIYLELSTDNRFKSQKCTSMKSAALRSLQIFVPAGSPIEEFQLAGVRAQKVARGVYFAQQLVSGPANYVNTVTLAQQAAKMGFENNLEVKILDTADIERLNMGAYLAVGKGSMYPPKFIHLTYKPPGHVAKKLAFIGKGICFDAGGYNMKNAGCQIELMKFDMGGAAAVLGTAFAIAQLQPKGVEVHFIIAAAENMVSDKAYRPGDVIVASNGKTIEVGNTDAEGRLTLADALVYADKMELDGIVDIATLTGACVVALGPKYAGVFSPNDDFADKVLESGKHAGELLWRMPMVSQYREMLDSKIADMNNIGKEGKGGAIIAAVFLKEFVKKTPWAHVDIAGPAWNYKESSATGFGVRTLTQVALEHASDI